MVMVMQRSCLGLVMCYEQGKFRVTIMVRLGLGCSSTLQLNNHNNNYDPNHCCVRNP